MPEDFIILGGGLTGLCLAYKLSKKRQNVTVFEAAEETGGLARSFNYKKHIFDIGPHIFRTTDRKILSFVKFLVNSVSVRSDPKIWKRPGILHDPPTPVISFNNLSLLPETQRRRALEEYAKIKNSEFKSSDNFEECIIAQVGETLYKEYFREYSEKFWGIPPKDLSADIAPHRLTIAEDAYYGHISASYKKPKTEIYPSSGGIGEIAKSLEKKARENGAKIITGAKVIDLVVSGNLIKSLVVEEKNSVIEKPCQMVISTIPITDIARMLKIPCQLTYRAIICTFIVVNKKRILQNKWLYFHDDDILFSRISEPQLFNKSNTPPNRTGICVEVPCQRNDSTWKDPYLGEKIIEQLDELNILKRDDACIVGVAKIPNAYPIFVKNYKSKLNAVVEEIQQFLNMRIAGRTGAFAYLNMDSSIKEAI